jgi:2'-5' RNA ligase
MQTYADYLVVISPPGNIMKEISRYKQASVNAIGHFEGMYSSGQVIITHQTRCKPFLVDPAIEQMASRLATIAPIELRFNGFDFFDHGHTAKSIYAVIERTDRTDNWFKLLQKQMGIKLKGFVPHIVIAKNLPVTSFNKLWPHFEGRLWSESFMVNHLTILHRDTFVEYCEWRVYKELFFANRLKEMF